MPHHEESIRATFAGLYTITRELGHGGMAYVFHAHRVADGAEVAVKVIRPELAVGIGYARFQREITLLQPLEHPHIFPLLEAGERGLYLYYAMPCAAGGSLKSRLVAGGPLPLADALDLARQIGSALDYAHARGLVHRDLKPENILWAGDRWVLCDFGVARAVEAAASESLSPSGLIIGTPQYMSPEQGQASRKIDHRSDLYALGCVLYEALAGHPPFTGATPQAVLARHVKERVPKLRVARPELPAHVEAAVEWLLAKKPKDRPKDAASVVEALQGS
jgi:eukaryotic-like serine/threonine-protein kinase